MTDMSSKDRMLWWRSWIDDRMVNHPDESDLWERLNYPGFSGRQLREALNDYIADPATDPLHRVKLIALLLSA